MVTEPSAQSASPLQPAKLEPIAGELVKVTIVPELYVPAGPAVPEPVPAVVIVRGYVIVAQIDPFQEVPEVQVAEIVIPAPLGEVGTSDLVLL